MRTVLLPQMVMYNMSCRSKTFPHTYAGLVVNQYGFLLFKISFVVCDLTEDFHPIFILNIIHVQKCRPHNQFQKNDSEAETKAKQGQISPQDYVDASSIQIF